MTYQTQKNDENTRKIAGLYSQINALAQTLGIALPPATAAPAKMPEGSVEITLALRLEAVLRTQVATLAELGELFGQPADVLLRELKAIPDVVNVGSELRPVYSALLGDEGDTAELIAKVESLISLRPMPASEIEAATGARRNRIRGALNRIQLRRKVQNHGTRDAALWFAPPVKR